MQHNIKLTLEYDGARFFGFQRQKDRPTIQAALEEALARLFQRPVKISGAAGRTDSGVHAAAQVVNFKIHSSLSPQKIQAALNALLPKEIVVKSVERVPPDFHARYGARWKTYEYRVFASKIRSPLLNGRAYQYPYTLDLARMRRAARKLVGRRDFKAFQAAGSSAASSTRTIRRFLISVIPSPFPLPLGERVGVGGKLIRFVIEADGFLYHMVRRIVGALLEVGRGRSLSLEGGSGHGFTVPSHGLTLLSVKYFLRPSGTSYLLQ